MHADCGLTVWWIFEFGRFAQRRGAAEVDPQMIGFRTPESWYSLRLGASTRTFRSQRFKLRDHPANSAITPRLGRFLPGLGHDADPRIARLDQNDEGRGEALEAV